MSDEFKVEETGTSIYNPDSDLDYQLIEVAELKEEMVEQIDIGSNNNLSQEAELNYQDCSTRSDLCVITSTHSNNKRKTSGRSSSSRKKRAKLQLRQIQIKLTSNPSPLTSVVRSASLELMSAPNESDNGNSNSQTSVLVMENSPELESQVKGERRKHKWRALFDGKYFEIVIKNEKKFCAQCCICKRLISGATSSTGNFLRHYRTNHTAVATTFEEYYRNRGRCIGDANLCKDSTANVTTQKNGNKTKSKSLVRQTNLDNVMKTKKKVTVEIFEKQLLLFIASGLHTLSVIEEPEFIQLCALFGMKVMSRKTLTRRLLNEVTAVTGALQNNLQKIRFMSTTADIWTVYTKSYLGVTLHWISETLNLTGTGSNYNLESTVIACRRITDVQTFAAACDLLHSIHSTFVPDLHKVIGTTTNNGSNFVRAFNHFGVSTENFLETHECDGDINEVIEQRIEFNDDDTIGLPLHFHCGSHTFNLLGTTGFMNIIQGNENLKKVHDEVMVKCNTLWKASKLENATIVIGKHLQKKMPIPGVTRWNSLYDSLLFVFQEIARIRIIQSELKMEVFNSSDLKYLETYLKCLKPIATGLDKLQQNIYYGYFLPTLFAVKIQLEQILTDNQLSEWCQLIARGLHNRLVNDERLRNFFILDFSDKRVEFAVLATFSLPYFKAGEWIPKDLQYNIPKIKQMAVEAAHVLENGDGPVSDRDSTSDIIDDDDFYGLFRGDEKVRAQPQESSDVNEEIHSYASSSKRSYSLFDKYQVVKLLFLKYNCVLACSAPVERFFSIKNWLCAPRRNKFSDQVFESMLILHGNKHLI